MAENKKSVVVYVDWIELFDALQDDEAGRLIKHFFQYVNDLDPKAPDRITELSFIQIKQSLKRDLKKYENYIEKQKANGLKGGRPKTQITQPFISKPKKADSDSDSDSVNDSDILIKEKEKFSNNLFNDPQWNEDICRMNKINSDILLKYLNIFDLKLKSELETKINKQEYASHFSRWLKIELKNEKKDQLNGKEKLTGAQAFLKQFE